MMVLALQGFSGTRILKPEVDLWGGWFCFFVLVDALAMLGVDFFKKLV